jgi:hypothetical protein
MGLLKGQSVTIVFIIAAAFVVIFLLYVAATRLGMLG